MKILVSACLLGENCKYNGGNNFSQKLQDLAKENQLIPVCPEVLGGLPTPRIPCEIVNGKVINQAGISCDAEYHKGAEIALNTAKQEKVDYAVLQSRSPSCGVKQIYDGTFSKTLIQGQGVFAKLLIDNHIRIIDIEDIEEGDPNG